MNRSRASTIAGKSARGSPFTSLPQRNYGHLRQNRNAVAEITEARLNTAAAIIPLVEGAKSSSTGTPIMCASRII